MRDIKFRAWIFGGLDEGEAPFMEEVAAIRWEYGETIIHWTECEEDSCPEEYVLMQYTGLKDKNGTEIYEGDIVRHIDADGPCCIKYHAGAYFADDGELAFSLFNNFGEVVGNIHEDPELLEEKE